MIGVFQEPVSATLRNMTNGETKQFLINPSELDLLLQASWKELDIKGMPNLPVQYQNTKNIRIRFTLISNRLYVQDAGKVSFERAKQFMKDYRAFLHSLVLPSNEENISGYQTSEPTKVWFNWPNVLSFPMSISSIRWKLTNFAIDLSSNHELAEVSAIVNLPDVLWSDEIRLTGW